MLFPYSRFLVGLAWTLSCALSPYITAHAAGLNDTGITVCSNDTGVVTTGVEADTGSHPRQDCRYGRDAAANAGMPKIGGGNKGFDFTKIANDGSALDASVALGTGPKDWACTRDNVTGLIWEVKTTSGLRSQSHTYTWHNSNGSVNGGLVGTASGGRCFATGRCDTEKFVVDVNATALCGFTDWRVPKVKELENIVEFIENSRVTIDLTFFPNTLQNFEPGAYFWSNSSRGSGSASAWYVLFVTGDANIDGKSKPHGVRLTRGGP